MKQGEKKWKNIFFLLLLLVFVYIVFLLFSLTFSNVFPFLFCHFHYQISISYSRIYDYSDKGEKKERSVRRPLSSHRFPFPVGTCECKSSLGIEIRAHLESYKLIFILYCDDSIIIIFFWKLIAYNRNVLKIRVCKYISSARS